MNTRNTNVRNTVIALCVLAAVLFGIISSMLSFPSVSAQSNETRNDYECASPKLLVGRVQYAKVEEAEGELGVRFAGCGSDKAAYGSEPVLAISVEVVEPVINDDDNSAPTPEAPIVVTPEPIVVVTPPIVVINPPVVVVVDDTCDNANPGNTKCKGNAGEDPNGKGTMDNDNTGGNGNGEHGNQGEGGKGKSKDK